MRGPHPDVHGHHQMNSIVYFLKEKDMEVGWEHFREVVVDPPEGRGMEMNITKTHCLKFLDSPLHAIYKLIKN